VSLVEHCRWTVKVSWENCELPKYTSGKVDNLDRSKSFLELAERHGDWPWRQGIPQVLLSINIHRYHTNDRKSVSWICVHVEEYINKKIANDSLIYYSIHRLLQSSNVVWHSRILISIINNGFFWKSIFPRKKYRKRYNKIVNNATIRQHLIKLSKLTQNSSFGLM